MLMFARLLQGLNVLMAAFRHCHHCVRALTCPDLHELMLLRLDFMWMGRDTFTVHGVQSKLIIFGNDHNLCLLTILLNKNFKDMLTWRVKLPLHLAIGALQSEHFPWLS